MSNLTTNRLEVVMDDGTEYEVFADQRDFAAWEATEFDGNHTMIRFWAWNAMKRRGQYGFGFEKFNTVDCAQVAVANASKAEEGEPDPTQESTSTPGRKTP